MDVKITKAFIKHKDDEKATIYWESNVGYGHLSIKYNGEGGFEIDAEYMGLDTVLKIIQKVNLNPVQITKQKVKPEGHDKDCDCQDCKLIDKIFNS